LPVGRILEKGNKFLALGRPRRTGKDEEIELFELSGGLRLKIKDGINLVSRRAEKSLQNSAIAQLELLAPNTFRWLCAIRDGRQGEQCGQGRADLALTSSLKPLLRIITSTFVALMRQNEKAYEDAVADGETVFNEAAFDRHRALYDGHLLGHPFRAVAKTFQVRVWRELKESWQALDVQDRNSLEQELLPDAGITFSPDSAV